MFLSEGSRAAFLSLHREKGRKVLGMINTNPDKLWHKIILLEMGIQWLLCFIHPRKKKKERKKERKENHCHHYGKDKEAVFPTVSHPCLDGKT